MPTHSKPYLMIRGVIRFIFWTLIAFTVVWFAYDVAAPLLATLP